MTYEYTLLIKFDNMSDESESFYLRHFISHNMMHIGLIFYYIIYINIEPS